MQTVTETLSDKMARESQNLSKKSIQTSANFAREPKDRLTVLRQKTDRNVVEGLELQELEIGQAESMRINSVTADGVAAEGNKRIAKELSDQPKKAGLDEDQDEDPRRAKRQGRADETSEFDGPFQTKRPSEANAKR